MPQIEWDDFQRVELRVGTIVAAEPNPKALKPAYVLRVDLGESGLKTSSAQLTAHYRCDELIGRQVLCVCNFAPNRPLKNVGEAANARQKQAKKRNLRVVNEHFEPVFNAAMATQVVFQQPAKRIAGLRSEVLVTGVYDAEQKVVLASFDKPLANGARLV